MYYNFDYADNGSIGMAMVEMGQKVFVRYEKAIHQAKVIGFTTGPLTYKVSEKGVAFRYLLHLGKGKDVWFPTFEFMMYSSVQDAIIGDPDKIKNNLQSLKDIGYKEFARKYLAGKNYFLYGAELHAYKWNGFEAVDERLDYQRGINFVNGKAELISAEVVGNGCEWSVKKSSYNPDDKCYQWAEDCKANNAPTIVMLDDEE